MSANGHRQRPGIQVNVAPSQPGGIAAAQARRATRCNKRVQPVPAHLAQELPRLGVEGGQEQVGGLLHAAETCPPCYGARYLEEVLDVRLDELAIAGVLGLTVHDAISRFVGRLRSSGRGWRPGSGGGRPNSVTGSSPARRLASEPHTGGGDRKK